MVLILIYMSIAGIIGFILHIADNRIYRIYGIKCNKFREYKKIKYSNEYTAPRWSMKHNFKLFF